MGDSSSGCATSSGCRFSTVLRCRRSKLCFSSAGGVRQRRRNSGVRRGRSSAAATCQRRPPYPPGCPAPSCPAPPRPAPPRTRGVLVDDEQIPAAPEAAQDEPEVELAQHRQAQEVGLGKHAGQLLLCSSSSSSSGRLADQRAGRGKPGVGSAEERGQAIQASRREAAAGALQTAGAAHSPSARPLPSSSPHPPATCSACSRVRPAPPASVPCSDAALK